MTTPKYDGCLIYYVSNVPSFVNFSSLEQFHYHWGFALEDHREITTTVQKHVLCPSATGFRQQLHEHHANAGVVQSLLKWLHWWRVVHVLVGPQQTEMIR